MLRHRAGGEEGDDETWKATPEETAERFLLVLMRYLKDWNRAELSAEIGVADSRMSLLDRGLKPIPRHVLERAAAKVGFPAHLLDPAVNMLRGFLVVARSGRSRPVQALAQSFAAQWMNLFEEITDVVLEPLTALYAKPARLPAPEERAEAERLWNQMAAWTPAERLLLVEEAEEYQTWALGERVAAASVDRASTAPKDGLALAELAVAIAERVRGGEDWRQRLQGLGWAAICNAKRAMKDLTGAEDALTQASKLWQKGAPGDPGLLNPAWLPWIEADLRRDQGLLASALRKVEEALELDSGELREKTLLSKSLILEAMGDAEGANQPS